MIRSWVPLGVVVLSAVLWWVGSAALTSTYNRGYNAALQKVQGVDTVYKDRVVQAQAKTDTIWKRTVQTIARTDTLISVVPESIRVQVPAVDAALNSCSAVMNECQLFRSAVVDERLHRDSLQRSLSANVVLKQDSIQRYIKRPTRKAQVFTTLVGAGLGYLAGRRP